MISALRLSDLGCHIGDTYIGCIAYADDIILLSASLGNLQKMLDICYIHGNELDVRFNASKTCLFTVGKCENKICCLVCI